MSDAEFRSGTGGKRLRRVGRMPSFVTWRTILALLLRQMSTTYGRNPGGYLWAVLEPALGILLLTAIFSAGFRSPSLGTNFAIFYASGYMPYMMWQKTATALGTSLRSAKNLLTFPRVTIVDALAARFFLEVMTQLLVSYIILTAIILMYDTRTVLKMPELITAYLMAMALGLGIGILNAFLITRFPLWRTAWGIVTRPLVLVSGVIFLHERVPQPYREWLEWNPLVHVTGMARRAFYISYHATYVDPVYVFTISGVTALIGAVFLRRYHRDILERT